MIRKIFEWIFKEELSKLKNVTAKYESLYARHREVFDNVLSGIDVSVDVHQKHDRYARSWAVVSLQGQKTDYIKFVDLRDKDILEIHQILKRYERSAGYNLKIDVSPEAFDFLKINRINRNYGTII